MREKREDYSMLRTWCENQAELEGTESWMCAPKGSRQQWEGAAALYRLFARDVDVNDLEAARGWLVGVEGAVTRLDERILTLLEEAEDEPA